METFNKYTEKFKGYQHVADFQRFCGVDIVEIDKLVHKNGAIPNGNGGTTTNGKEANGSCQNGSTNGTVANGSENGVSHRTNGLSSTNSVERNEKSHSNGTYKNGVHNPDGNETRLAYKIQNNLVFYLFVFGAGLGGEIFYIIFFPFMMWNIDSRMTRHLLLIWAPLMYVGQFLKDCIRWPRPGPPAVRLEGKRFQMEYGMPSTHTIVGTCMPFSLLILTSRIYEYPFIVGLGIAVVWTALVAFSRIYLGMHTALDVVAGISMTALALPWMLNVVDSVDYFQVTSAYAPFFSVLVPLLACIYYPKPKVWSITRGDTSNIVSIASCVAFGSWFHYQMGWMTVTPTSDVLQPLPSVTLEWLLQSTMRTILGVVALAVSRILSEKIFKKFVCTCAGVDIKDITRQRELGLEVPIRWLTIGGLAINTSISAPLIFYYLGIGREGFYSELGV